MEPHEIENEILYGALVNMGQYYPLDLCFDTERLERELEPFRKDWKPYNPRKAHIPREGLSLTSLDGGLSGSPDLDSLSEFNRENGTHYSESSFTQPTAVLMESRHLKETIAPFIPYLGRSHLIRFGEGGYFPPHRDSQYLGADSFRLIALLKNSGGAELTLMHADRKLMLEHAQLYFMNTKVDHSVFSFAKDATILVLNVRLSRESVTAVTAKLLTR